MERDQAGGDSGSGMQQKSGPESVESRKSHQEEQWVQKQLMEEQGAGTGPRAHGSGW